MNRLTVLQMIIDKIRAKTYLEIGVETGIIISEIRAPVKIAVDPEFRFPKKLLIKKALFIKHFKTYRETSNSFFEKHAEQALPNGLDIAFIDGLHTYSQSLLDVENCLKYLNKGGIIVMHDCSPLSYANAFPVKESINEMLELANNGDLSGWNGCWSGDVWKTIAHLRIKYDELNIFTLDLDWGLGIISRGESTKLIGFTLQDIANADFYFLEQHRAELLNLKHPKYIKEFLQG